MLDTLSLRTSGRMNFNSCFMFLINYGHPLVGDDDQDDWAGRKQSQQGGRKWQTARKEVFNLISPSRIFGPILPSRIFGSFREVETRILVPFQVEGPIWTHGKVGGRLPLGQTKALKPKRASVIWKNWQKIFWIFPILSRDQDGSGWNDCVRK